MRNVAGGHPAMLVGMGNVQVLFWRHLLEAVMTLGLGVLLIRQYGIIGMGVAVLIARAVTRAGVLAAATCKTLGHSWFGYLVQTIVPSVIASVPPLIACLAFKRLLPPHNLITLLVEAFWIGLLSVFTTFFLCFPKDIRAEIIGAFKAKRKVAKVVGPSTTASESAALP
jgi:hypothetical protein